MSSVADRITSSSTALLAPKLIRVDQYTDSELEVSLHYLPKPLKREFAHVFGDEHLDFVSGGEDGDGDATMAGDGSGGEPMELLAIPTNQRAREDLVAVGDSVELEKDRLLNVFLLFGESLTSRIRSASPRCWADYIDPCSGLPMLASHRSKVYSEVDGMECLLRYKAHNAGFCKVLTHPEWGSAVYPATLFAYAPVGLVKELIESYPSGK